MTYPDYPRLDYAQQIWKGCGVDGNSLVAHLHHYYAVVETILNGTFKPAYGPSKCCRRVTCTYPQLGGERAKRARRKGYRSHLEELRRQRALPPS